MVCASAKLQITGLRKSRAPLVVIGRLVVALFNLGIKTTGSSLRSILSGYTVSG